MMSITYAGVIAIFVIILLIFRLKGKIYLLPTFPLFMVSLNFFNYFGHYKIIDIQFSTEILLLTSFFVFLLSYSIGKKRTYKKAVFILQNLIKKQKTEGQILTEKKSLFIFIFIVVLYCCFDLWLNSHIYGSLEAALTRFYAKQKLESVPNILVVSQLFIFKFIVSFIFIFRYYQNIYNKNSKFIYVPVFLLVLIAFPKGSRGAVVEPITMLLFADILTKRFCPGFSLMKKIWEYLSLGFFSLVLIFTLTFIRGINFEDLSTLQEQLSNFKLYQGVDEFNENETDLMIGDTQFVFENFGNKYSYLGLLFTIKTILINPVPRFLYPDKPVAFGVLLTEAKFGSGDFSIKNLTTINTGFAVGVAGEGWANWGLMGLLLYSIIMGLYSGFFSKLYSIFINSSNYLSLLFAICFFHCTSNFIRGDLHSGVVQGIYPILLLIVFIIIFYRKR